jgi:imidazole glycerol-phosphate synthase subunit HisF
MIRPRVIPALLLRNAGLVKTVKFKNPLYLGDPINVVRIFNDKQADELVFLDITATRDGNEPPFDLLKMIASECFMPFSYGGGIRNLDQVQRLISIGIEKVVINSHAVEDRRFISLVANLCGSSSTVVSIDVKKNWRGKYEVVTCGSEKQTGIDPVEYAKEVEESGAGEIFLNSVDRDGTMRGYDLDLIKRITSATSIPVIACGGAGNVQDLFDVMEKGGASAAAAGSIFVLRGKRRAVLITYPSQEELDSLFSIDYAGIAPS